MKTRLAEVKSLHDLSPGIWGYDDLEISDRMRTGTAVITPGLIDAFAELSGDRFAIHMSDREAQEHGFKARVAHGLLVLSVIDGLKNAAPAQVNAVASLGWDWNFVAPVFAGDSIWTELVVARKHKTRNLTRGIVRLDIRAINQDGEIVQAGSNLMLLYRQSSTSNT
jgi:3-hydroxybutyryl-CoA dehydratase